MHHRSIISNNSLLWLSTSVVLLIGWLMPSVVAVLCSLTHIFLFLGLTLYQRLMRAIVSSPRYCLLFMMVLTEFYLHDGFHFWGSQPCIPEGILCLQLLRDLHGLRKPSSLIIMLSTGVPALVHNGWYNSCLVAQRILLLFLTSYAPNLILSPWYMICDSFITKHMII